MDRVLDHTGMEVLSPTECDELLASVPVGRVAFLDDGDPVILPVNFLWRGGVIIFRTSVGSKLDAAIRHRPVAFEVDDWDSKSGWSVLVRGVAHEVLDGIDELDSLGLEPWAAERDRWVEIRPAEITGRRIV